MNIVAAAAAHQHKLQHLLMLTEQNVMYAFLAWKFSPTVTNAALHTLRQQCAPLFSLNTDT